MSVVVCTLSDATVKVRPHGSEVPILFVTRTVIVLRISFVAYSVKWRLQLSYSLLYRNGFPFVEHTLWKELHLIDDGCECDDGIISKVQYIRYYLVYSHHHVRYEMNNESTFLMVFNSVNNMGSCLAFWNQFAEMQLSQFVVSYAACILARKRSGNKEWQEQEKCWIFHRN